MKPGKKKFGFSVRGERVRRTSRIHTNDYFLKPVHPLSIKSSFFFLVHFFNLCSAIIASSFIFICVRMDSTSLKLRSPRTDSLFLNYRTRAILMLTTKIQQLLLPLQLLTSLLITAAIYASTIGPATASSANNIVCISYTRGIVISQTIYLQLTSFRYAQNDPLVLSAEQSEVYRRMQRFMVRYILLSQNTHHDRNRVQLYEASYSS